MIIHASKYVRIDQLTVNGIITHHGKQTHELYEVRRV
jgi:hypothetical protein